MKKLTRRDFLAAGGTASVAALAAGCSFGTGQQKAAGSGGSKSVTIWDISTGDQQKLIKNTVARFDSTHKDISVSVQFFQNDPYKNKLRTAMGAGNPPDIFFGWGGGILKSYVDAGKVYALPQGSIDTNKFFPSVMRPVTFNGKVYGVPMLGTQPVLFYYNKEIFGKYNLKPPKTWSELLSIVKTLSQKGITPISLAGQNKWPDLMYEEYLVNRIGGPKPFQNVLDKKPKAWSDPAFIKANTMIQQLVSMKAFPSNFASLNYDTGQSTQLLYTGKAAMQLMGAWDYQAILSNAPQFIKSGKLGWFPFPKVEGGKGNPQNVAGNLTNYYSVTQASKAKKAATTFLDKGIMNDYEINGLIKIGLVPPVKGIQSKLKQQKDSDWLLFVYDLAQNAPYYDLSWDQALPARAAQALLTNLDLLFLKKITPQQFSKNMNKAMGL
ncbi:MAG: extracellular solute-binding protein [Rubrobacteraceae bacterium]|nr:extracellular solute-binding protein [Rubrobacteraceae bacterium]